LRNDENGHLYNGEIVSICFDFDRPEIIELMKERGKAILAMEVEKVKELEDQIEKIEEEKERRPYSAYITFAESRTAQYIL
jgi:hypothetical protein